MNTAAKAPLNNEDRQRFMQALEEYRRNGSSTVTCDSCGSPIRFYEAGSATKHECTCGKFTGSLRGL